MHIERMADDRLPKRAAELREEGRRRRGRPRLRWEVCVKRDVKKAGEEGDWKKKTTDRGGWKRLSDEAVMKLRAAPHNRQREKEEERERDSTRSQCSCLSRGSDGEKQGALRMTQAVLHTL